MHEGERWEGGGRGLGRRTLLVINLSPISRREKRRDFDFLSSLEVVIVDQTDVFLMQNWSHLTVRECWRIELAHNNSVHIIPSSSMCLSISIVSHASPMVLTSHV